MGLAPGTRLGAYEIAALIGAGGMGEVYRAWDTRLKRDVAIKVLPEAFASDHERLARLQREAEILASLSHPNIAHIYGIEQNALVLELVDGPTLADRIAQGPIPLDEALPIARQIAEALEAAHEHGIIHRDLKPANIKVTADGKVRVLDFGLAKAVEGSSAPAHSTNLSQSPTITSPAITMGGVILGTAAYMSPEQAKGKSVDKRTDIWAFGCVLFEIITAKRAFTGEDITDTLAEILKSDPDWAQLPAQLPESIRRVLRRSLVKDRRSRLPDAAVLRIEIDEALNARLSQSAYTHRPAEAPRRRMTTRERLAWMLSAVSVLLLGVIASRALPDPSRDLFPYHTSVLPPPGSAFGSPNVTPASLMAISPDGRRLAYIATDNTGKSMLWMRPLNSAVALPLEGTEAAREPFWSADSRAVGFIADGKLKRIDAAGGPVLTIANGAAQTGAWNPDDVILFAPTNNSPVHRVSASGGSVTPVMELDASEGERMHDGPVFLPDGDHFLYVAVGSNVTGPNQPRGVYVGSLAHGGKGRLLFDNGSNVQYANGHLLYLRDTMLLAHRFDLNTMTLVGDAMTITERVSTGGTTGRGGAFSVSQTGLLAYQTGSSNAESPLQWFDRTGKPLGAVGQAGDYDDVDISSDGKYAAAAVLNAVQRTRDIWIIDLARNVPTKFTFDSADEVSSRWSPDGQWLAFGRRREGTIDLFRKSVHGKATEEKLVDRGIPLDWSADGRQILFLRSGSNPAGQLDLWVFSLDTRTARAYLETPFNEPAGVFSPNGKWIAYISAEAGTPEVYIDTFPSAGQKQRISTDGGTFVRWQRDGRVLFYRNATGMIMAVGVDAVADRATIGAAKALFRAQVRPGFGLAQAPLDVTPDGQRFLLISRGEPFSAPISLVLNWPSLLSKQ